MTHAYKYTREACVIYVVMSTGGPFPSSRPPAMAVEIGPIRHQRTNELLLCPVHTQSVGSLRPRMRMCYKNGVVFSLSKRSNWLSYYVTHFRKRLPQGNATPEIVSTAS